MHSRWYNIAVVALWLSTMTWLVYRKVLPSMLVGDPPSYPAILAAQKNQSAAGWTIVWKDKSLGWAVIRTKPLPQALTEVRSHVHFDTLPLQEMSPEWLRHLLPLEQLTQWLVMDSQSTLIFDPLSRLSRFESTIDLEPKEGVRRVEGVKQSLVKIQGTIDGATLELWIRCGDLTPLQPMKIPLPRNVMLSDAISPQGCLPGLRHGQTWTVETYSPLRPPSDPIEIVHATVEQRGPLLWNGRVEEAWLVVYRSDPGAALKQEETVRGRLWVRPDGTVLKQEVLLLGASLLFVRLGQRESDELAVRLAPPATLSDRP